MHRSSPVVELAPVLEALIGPVLSVVPGPVVGSTTPDELLLLSEFEVVLVGTSVLLEVEPLGSVAVPVVGSSMVVPCVPVEPSVAMPPESPHAARAGATSEIP